ncbi:MAG: S41 family peptidase [candidate division WOR-3 bacterium]|nr:S41 family peptidase [candidate division WOR-3 bacterium]
MVHEISLVLCMIGVIFFVSTVSAQEPDDVNVWIASYDTVWQTVNEHHYDSTFGGLDWNEIHDRYYNLVVNVKDDDGFIEIVNKMLAELKLSHYAVFHMKKIAASGSPLVSDGTIGLDIRLLDNKVVVTSVKPGFPAAEAGLKIGYALESIDGISIEQIIAEAESREISIYNERKRLSDIADNVCGRFFGDAGTSISLTFRDEFNALHETTMIRKQRVGKTMIDESLPPFYVDFEARRMDDNIGYISFSAFLPPVDERFSQAIDTMGDMRGLIIDIRGNPGGMHEVGEAIVSKLLQKETLFSVFRYRDRTEEVVVQPAEKTYDGPVVVMIDVMNASASERFSGCIQSVGRAVVIGERSSGSVGPSDIKELPNGASFMYLISQSLTPDGTVLEGHGVIPDIVVGLDKQALLAGRDTQLERAVEYINNETR